jgi:hypothetical protein
MTHTLTRANSPARTSFEPKWIGTATSLPGLRADVDRYLAIGPRSVAYTPRPLQAGNQFASRIKMHLARLEQALADAEGLGL